MPLLTYGNDLTGNVMESTGFNVNAAKIAAVQAQQNSPQSLSANKVSSQSEPTELQLTSYETLKGLKIEKAASPHEALIDELNGYQGYQFDEETGRGSDAVIYQDKQTVFDGSDPHNPKYFEVASVFNKHLSEEENQTLIQKIMDNKLDPSATYDYFKEGQDSGSMKMEYGISPFDWKTLRGMAEEDTYKAGDAKDALRDSIVNHAFSANGTVTTKSGKEVQFSFSYQEQNRLPPGVYIMGSQETYEEYNTRVQKESAREVKSEEDYRAINFTFSSNSPLSKDEASALNKLAQSIMRTADQVSQGIMDNRGYDLEKQFSDVESLFKSVEINAKYKGAAQEDTDYRLSILNGSTSAKLDIEELAYRTDYNAIRFWDDR